VTTTLERVPFTVPAYTDGARAAALRVLDSGWTTTGPECAAFEEEFARYLGVEDVVTVASCTQGLELSLRALRLRPGAAVLTPSLTFSGAVAAIVHAGYRPVLVDVDEHTLVPNERTVAAAARRADQPAAMVVCHLGGYPVDVAALAAAAGLHRSRVVEDAAHGPGGDVTGQRSVAACFSFYATKNLPVGEGGAVATDDPEVAAWLRSARLHGMSRDAWRRYLPGGSWRYDVPEIGLKANLTDLQAAIARAQLPALAGWQARRAQLVAQYDAALATLVTLPARHAGHAWHLYQLRVRGRDAVAARLSDAQVGTSVHFIPVHQFSGFAALLGPAECREVPVTDRVAEELLSLPLYPALTDSQQETVIDHVSTTVRGMG
jgi:dTDP-4-amino-4,6-dideoxygalactose transaminase